jgi:hypothetical protein
VIGATYLALVHLALSGGRPLRNRGLWRELNRAYLRRPRSVGEVVRAATGRSMTGIRRAFVLASLGRYLMMAIKLAATAIMARLLAPADYGVAVLGGSVPAVAEAIRTMTGY